MDRRHFLSYLATTSVIPLVGCTSSQVERSIALTEQILDGEIPEEIADKIPLARIEEIRRLARQQLDRLLIRVRVLWKDSKVASVKEYVKYTYGYQSRAIVNFESGEIIVETVVKDNPLSALQHAIAGTLLTPEDPVVVDLMSDRTVEYRGTPFLHNLVLDQDDLPIRYPWRANRYADHLMKTAYQTRLVAGKTVHYVSFTMEKNHQQSQQLRYQDHVTTQANRFRLQTALINSIIEVESSFNPYAVSPAPAYGLMQIVPTSAGRDAYRLLHNKDGIPSRETLFQPGKNIEMGSAYLHILFNRYLARVEHPISKEYCVIAAYNTGSSNVLKAFDSSRTKAFSRINNLDSSQVYDHLRKNLRYAEARNYLRKVTAAKNKYL